MDDNFQRSQDDKNPPCPSSGKREFVNHNGRTRFAYLNTDGKWRDCYTHEVLEGAVLPLEKMS